MLSCPQVVKSPSPDCSTRLTNSHSILPVYYALMITYSSPMLFFYRNCLTPRFNFSNSNSRTLFISTCKSGAYHVARVPFERERERSAARIDPLLESSRRRRRSTSPKSTEQMEKDGQKATIRLPAGGRRRLAMPRGCQARPTGRQARVGRTACVRRACAPHGR
jgi:hypothetical protein